MLYLYLILAILGLLALCLYLIRGIRRDRLDQEFLRCPEADQARLDAAVELRRADRPVFVVRMSWPHRRLARDSRDAETRGSG